MPSEIMQQEPSGQTPISIVETVTITIPEGAATNSGREEESDEKTLHTRACNRI